MTMTPEELARELCKADGADPDGANSMGDPASPYGAATWRRWQEYEERARGLLARICTDHVYPPIPTRNCDWCAYYDGEEELEHYGWGNTEDNAILDLAMNWEPAA